MANALYGLGREAFLQGTIDWDANVISIILADAADYTTVLIDADDFMTDIPSAGQVPVFSSGPALASKTETAGVADAADTTFTALSGDPSEYLIVFEDDAVEATCQLLVFIDTATGLTLTPNSGDVTVQWDSGTDRIFTL